MNGVQNRGFFHPIDEFYFRKMDWRADLLEELLTRGSATGEIDYRFDAVIYLHNDACQSEDSLTMTLAHELQHFSQYGLDRTVWASNTLVTRLSRVVIERLGLRWIDIPIEFEARLVAKRISEKLLGRDRIARYIESRLKAHVTDGDAEDWALISGIKVSEEYDCKENTRALFRRIAHERGAIEQALRETSDLPDFASLDIDELILPIGPNSQ
jgi:hypothetical protein